jgi:starch synthase (maltosyl-transferring)
MSRRSSSALMRRSLGAEGRVRTVIENVTPQIDRGRFPAKRVVGDTLEVQADAFGDGHDEIRVRLRWRRDGVDGWQETEMEALGNDRWRATFELAELGRYEYSVAAWVDRFRTWQHDLAKRLEAGQDVRVDLLIGAELVEPAAQRAQAAGAARDAAQLGKLAERLRTGRPEVPDRLVELIERHPDRGQEACSETFTVVVDPPHARFSAWYELFPRSTSPDAHRHGTFRDVVARLPYVERLGFNVLYLPPIHPIGRQYRKGPNNVASQDSSDPGVPWAIGGPEGGHTAVQPQLGTLDDFRALVAAARKRRIEVALDIAFQASPDHPWVSEHPTWFRARPDGTIQYAENPPKKYQDIYPFDFESEDWQALWRALNEVFRFWIGQGVTIFRVDNPHTKSFAFWEWCIGDLKADHPEVLFLAEAFTRPRVMYRLAKLGFSQSYTYFTWRNSPAELREYLTELTSPPVNEFFRPNFWPNTPDILHADLQVGTRAAFAARLVLAATLSSNYGIYGPAFELMEHTPREPGSEEYLNSEKYQQRQWDLEAPGSLAPLISRVNAARRDHPALQTNERLWFHAVDNDALLAYSKNTADQRDVVLAVVNMDYVGEQAGSVTLDLGGLGLPADEPFEAVDLLDGQVYEWQGRRNWVVLDPAVRAAHLFWLHPVAAVRGRG